MSITLDQVTKRYQAVPVVNDVSLKIGTASSSCCSGPSGSGKSTLLRAIAGLTEIDHGRIFAARPRRHARLGARARRRLRLPALRAVPAHDRRRQHRVRAAGPRGAGGRAPRRAARSCCGSSRSRAWTTACRRSCPAASSSASPWRARSRTSRRCCCWTSPSARSTPRSARSCAAPSAQIQRELGITTILVTHDQEEAFALADRIGVMHLGRLLECGRPDELYARPATRFVATFLGAANLLLGYRTSADVRFNSQVARDTRSRARSSPCCGRRKSS